MQKGTTLKGNFIWNASYQVLSVFLPLITLPYITRVLGTDPVGIYSKTHAYAEFFYLFAMLGVKNYGNRAIARVRDDRVAASRTFWEIYAFQALTSLAAVAAYAVFCLNASPDNHRALLPLTLYVVSGLFDINWLFFGLERFRMTTIRSMAIRVLTLAAIFLFVHHEGDLGVYAAILAGGELLSALVIWPFALRSVDFSRPTWQGIRRHIRPNLLLFWPVLAISLYNTMDKVILGAYSSDAESAFYGSAERITIVPYYLLLALDNVVMPRMSNIYARAEEDKARALMDRVMLFTMFLSAALSFGMAGVGEVFAPWFYGASFKRCGLYIMLLSPTILFKGWGGALRTQFIIPTGRDRLYVVSLSAGAAVNLLLDFLLIPRLAGVGAIAGTLAAEATVAGVQFFMCRRDIPFRRYLAEGAGFCAIGLVMFLVVRAMRHLGGHPLVTMALQVICGGVLYLLLSALFMVKVLKKPGPVNEALRLLRPHRKA